MADALLLLLQAFGSLIPKRYAPLFGAFAVAAAVAIVAAVVWFAF